MVPERMERMTRYGITGPTAITSAQETFVEVLVAGELCPGDVLTSGAAFGVDFVGAAMAAENGAAVCLTVPGTAWHNEALVQRGEREGWEIVRVADKSTPAATYMKRNDATVARMEVLLAFPPTATEERGRGRPGSGTWATIRRARKAGCEIRFYPLDGSDPWIEPSTRLFSKD